MNKRVTAKGIWSIITSKWLLIATVSFALFVNTLAAASGADGQPFDVDVILSMSGPLTFVGNAEYDALSILETTVNKQGGIRGRPVHFVFYDDKTDPQVAVQLLNTILAKHPSIILGSTSAVSCLAMAPLLKDGPVEYCLSPSLYPARGSYLFSSSVSVRDCWIALVRYFGERGWKRIGVLTGTDQSGQDADASLAAALALPENKDVRIVSHQHFSPTDLTVTAQLALLKAAKPQAVILWAAGTPFATLLRGAADIGLDMPVGASNANLTSVQMKQYGSFLPKELDFPGLPFLVRQAPTKRAQNLQRQFFDAFKLAGKRPDFLDNFAWDPGLIAISALRAIGTAATADQVRNYIENLHGFNGISGEYNFRDGSQRGLSEKNLMMLRWDSDKGAWSAVSRLGGFPLH